MELVVCFLYLAQTECSRCRVDGSPKRLTDRYDFGIGPAGRGTVSLELIGMPQRTVGGSAERQVVGVQILQGAARLGKQGFYIVLDDRQQWPAWRQYARKVAGLVVWLELQVPCRAASAAWSFSSTAVWLAGHHQRRGIRHPQRGSGIQYRRRQRLQPVQYRGTRATKVQRHPLSFDQALGALNIIGGSRMVKGFDLQAIVFIPLAGTYM